MKKYVCFLFSLIPIFSIGQDYKPQFQNTLVTFSSPEAVSMQRYAHQPPDLSNGRVQQNINILTIQEKGVSFNLSLYYNYSGFRLKEDATRIGLGWGLTEGAITKQVKHVDDDHIPKGVNLDGRKNYLSLYDESFREEYGYGSRGASTVGGSCTTIPSVVTYPAQYDYTRNRLYYKLYDGQPDMYTYSFNGYSGKFVVIGEKNNLSSEKVVKLDHNDLVIDKSGDDILIITPDGIHYEFELIGRTFSSSFNMEGTSCCADRLMTSEFEYQKNEWKLINIYNPNTGGYIKFTYEEFIKRDHKRPEEAQSVTLVGRYQSLFSDRIDYNGVVGVDENTSYSVVNHMSILKAIETNSLNVNILYDDNEDRCIKSINVYDKSTPAESLQTVTFNHGYFGNSSEATKRWLKLKYVQITGLGKNEKYVFNYVDENYISDLLDKNGKSIDHWGYYNGASNMTLFPLSIKQRIDYISENKANYPNNLIWANRMSNFDFSKKFALERVTYPTGGYTKYDYEASTLGIRVYHIEDSDNDTPISHRYYTYEGGQGGYYDPMYTEKEHTTLVYNDNNKNISSFRHIVSFSAFPEDPNYREYAENQYVYFKKITEYHGFPKGANGKIEYEYIDNLYYPFCKVELGSKKQYNSNNEIVRQESTEYEVKCLGKIPYWTTPVLTVTGDVNTGIYTCLPTDVLSAYPYVLGGIQTNLADISYNWVKPKKITIIENGITSMFENRYRSVNEYEDELPLDCNIVEIKQINSNGKVIKTGYKYPKDFISESPYDIMCDIYTNMVGLVVEMTDFVDDTELSVSKLSYKNWNDGLYRGIAPWMSTRISGNDVKNIVSYYNYDTYGNPLYIRKDESIGIVYLWSYNGRYPVAEIQNTTYEEVYRALTGITPQQLSDMLVPDMGKVGALRSALPHAHVTTYKYKPLVGIIESTDSREVTTYYDYDDLDRLKRIFLIENGVEKIINSYDYHYRNQ